MIYDNIKALCEKNDINIHTLERDLGIGNGVIGKWGAKRSSPRVSTIKRIADYFGCTVDELLSDD